MIFFATISIVETVRPAKNTSAPSAASSVATAEPIEPPAPNTTAHLSRSNREVDIAPPYLSWGRADVVALYHADTATAPHRAAETPIPCTLESVQVSRLRRCADEANVDGQTSLGWHPHVRINGGLE